jgi:hypothetical protein
MRRMKGNWIKVVCGCGHQINFGASFAGRDYSCCRCSRTIHVPGERRPRKLRSTVRFDEATGKMIETDIVWD